jgi:hypothetical protein
VLYVYFEAYHVVLLCFVYGKNELDDISADAKKQINKAIHKIEHELQRRGAIK